MSERIAWPGLARGLVAILRGITPDSAVDVAGALAEAGFEAIEVPLNSPDPFDSIERIAAALGQRCLVGAGTVLEADDVARLAAAGGRLCVSPNVDPAVIAAARAAGMVTLPGVFSPSEALTAARAGASALKFFPASVLGPSGIAAVAAVLPAGLPLAAVGGVSERDFAGYATRGVSLFGLGSSLYRPGATADETATRATAAVAAYDAVFGAEAARPETG